MNRTRVNLYTTVGCHLCDEALAMLHRARRDGIEVDVCEVEISDSESLMRAYGIRIPVLRIEGRNEELGWPFDYEQMIQFIER